MKLRNLIFAAVMAGLTASAQAETVLRVGTGQAAADPQNVILQEVADRVSERTGGELVLQIFPAGQLGSERDVHEQVKLGAPILSVVDSGYFANYSSKDVGILSAPFVFKTYDEVKTVLASDLAKGWMEQAEKNGIKMLSFNWFFGERHILGKKAFPNAADLRQIKFRLAPINIYIDSFSALGVSPVTLDFAELYGALQQGVVDAAEGPLSSLWSSRLFEVAPFVTRTGHVKQVLGIMMNKQVFDALPSEHQAILVDEMTAGGERFSEQNIAQQSELQAQMEKGGAKFLDADVSGYIDTVIPLYSGYKDWSPGLVEEVQAIAAGQ